MSIPELSVVIVTYNRWDLLKRCLASLAKIPPPVPHEIIVVDNGDQAETAERLKNDFPAARYCPTGKNGGYSFAVNHGFAKSGAPLVALLNNDCEVQPGSYEPLLEAMEKFPDLGVAGGMSFDFHGRLAPARRRFPRLLHAFFNRTSLLTRLIPFNPWTREFLMADVPQTVEMDVDWISGHYMIIRREAFGAVQGWDEGFFLWMDDIDFCLRLARAGWRRRYIPRGTMVHQLTASHANFRYARAQAASMWRYYRKHLRRGWWMDPVVGAGIALKFAAALLFRR